MLNLVPDTGHAEILHKHKHTHRPDKHFSKVKPYIWRRCGLVEFFSMYRILRQIILYVCVNELFDIRGSEVAKTRGCVVCKRACVYIHVDL